MFTTACPSCGHNVRVPDAYQGRRVKCPKCSKPLAVTSAPREAPTPDIEDQAAAFLCEPDQTPRRYAEPAPDEWLNTHATYEDQHPLLAKYRELGYKAMLPPESQGAPIPTPACDREGAGIPAKAWIALVAALGLFVVCRLTPDKPVAVIEKELRDAEADRRQQEMERERARKARETLIEIEAIKKDIERNPQLYPKND